MNAEELEILANSRKVLNTTETILNVLNELNKNGKQTSA
jgi:hypothetical protein